MIDRLPPFFSACLVSQEEALQTTIKSGMTIASGFATSEPHTFYAGLWDFIQKQDLVDLRIRQALFMAPHPLCVGKALSAKGRFKGLAKNISRVPLLGDLAQRTHIATKKLEGLRKLIEHYRELKARRIRFASPFIGPASNIIVPDNPITRVLYPEYVGRNATRMGIMDMQSIHFPDAVDSMAYDPDGRPLVDTVIAVLTPPNEQGEMSHGVANGASGEMMDRLLKLGGINLVLYLNPRYPFTRGYHEAGNTVHVDQFERLAREKRLFVIQDQGKIPALPAHSFDNPAPSELAIAGHVVNHMEMNKRFTYGRALQVGIGGTGVLAIKALLDSGWHGRCYTEMLEPFTLKLFEAGKIAGSHFIESDGRRTELDGKLVCTFTMCEEGSDFYQKLDHHPALVLATASRVVIPEAFHHGLGVNNCLGIDFHGHVNSGGRDKNHYSGVGGGAIIMRGLGKGGVGYLCLKSTHRTSEGKLRSSIFPLMPQGTPISHIGPDLMGGREGARFFLVTEHGVAQLSGKTQSQFIQGLISVADPRFRDWLKRKAFKLFRVEG